MRRGWLTDDVDAHFVDPAVLVLGQGDIQDDIRHLFNLELLVVLLGEFLEELEVEIFICELFWRLRARETYYNFATSSKTF